MPRSFFSKHGPDVTELYQTLRQASPSKRRGIVHPILDGLLVVGSAEGDKFAALTELAIEEVTSSAAEDIRGLRPGEFTPGHSAILGKSSQRVRGFGGAIARAADVQTFLDLGTGSTAIWPLLITHLHPNAEGQAIELNDKAAECAQEMVGLFGVSDRVTVLQGDATTMPLPSDPDLGVTETWNMIGSLEPGFELAYAMRGARILLPSEVRINAAVRPRGAGANWQLASIINLREPNPQITGAFTSEQAGRLLVVAHAEYHGDTGPILVDPLDDMITGPKGVGVVEVPEAGNTIHFSYTPGAPLEGEHQPKLWVTA